MKYIVNGDFCEVVSDKFVEHGVKRGHRVYVVGTKALPLSENDPYTQRIKMLVHRMEGDHIISKEIYLMDPISILKLDDNEQKRLHDVMVVDFPLGETA